MSTPAATMPKIIGGPCLFVGPGAKTHALKHHNWEQMNCGTCNGGINVMLGVRCSPQAKLMTNGVSQFRAPAHVIRGFVCWLVWVKFLPEQQPVQRQDFPAEGGPGDEV